MENDDSRCLKCGRTRHLLAGGWCAECTKEAPDTIYLQTGPEATWCRDKIEEDDVEYRRTTPSREPDGFIVDVEGMDLFVRKDEATAQTEAMHLGGRICGFRYLRNTGEDG